MLNKVIMSKKVHFLRHGQSFFNIGIDGPDPELTDDGKRQASTVSGEYDLVIVSGLRRTMQTLEHSQIKYRERIMCELCREYRAGSSCDYKHDEVGVTETPEELYKRVSDFRNYLKHLVNGYSRILVISHAVFMQVFLQKYDGIGNCQLIQAEI